MWASYHSFAFYSSQDFGLTLGYSLPLITVYEGPYQEPVKSPGAAAQVASSEAWERAWPHQHWVEPIGTLQPIGHSRRQLTWQWH